MKTRLKTLTLSLFLATLPLTVFEWSRLLKILQHQASGPVIQKFTLFGLVFTAYTLMSVIMGLSLGIIISLIQWCWHLCPTQFITDKRLRHGLQFTIITAAFSLSVFLIYVFQTRFHDPDMIRWSLFILIGFIAWAALTTIVLLEKHASPHTLKSRTSAGGNRSWLVHPVTLPLYILLITFVLNLSWIQYVIDLPALGLFGLFLGITYQAWRWLQKIAWVNGQDRKAPTIVCVLIVMAAFYPFFRARHPQFSVLIDNHGILVNGPSKIPGITDLSNKLIPLMTGKVRSISNKFGKPILPDQFDLQAWNSQNIQDYNYYPANIEGNTCPFSGSGKDWNVIFLTVDALRSDHMSCYGYPFPTTPYLDALAREGALFERHYTQGGDSIFSLNSILSGMLPWNFLEEDHPMLSEILTRNGYETAYVGYDYVLKGGAFRSGFKIVDLIEGDRKEVWGKSTSQHSINRIMKMIDQLNDKPFLIYSHLLDPHADFVTNTETHRFEKSSHPHYDGEIAYTDREIGRLVSYLRRERLLEKTILVITADHGEAFNEHGHLWHGKFLYDESVRTPLIISLPDLYKRRIKLPVGPVNIVPTILDFIGVQKPAEMDGVSLLPLIYHGDVSDVPLLEMYIPHDKWAKRAWVYGPWKYIKDSNGSSQELYDLFNDPKETENLIGLR